MVFALRSSTKGRQTPMEKNRSVLVVDDDESLNRVMAELLQAKGFEVRTAYNGVQGYTCYLRHPTQFVVTDIQMPDLDGIEMMRCIRAINPAVKTIYVSGALEPLRGILGMEEGDFATVFLNKPFSAKDLLRALYGGFDGENTGDREF